MINLIVPHQSDPSLKPCITVIGVGGAGGNAVGNMISDGLQGVEFLVANTDAQALSLARTDRRIQLGANTTQGLGAGAKPEIGQAAAEESIDRIAAELEGSNMVFITAGMGGGTGTGAAPVIARVARELGILTVGVVTKPFQFEGQQRMRLAEHGIEQLSQYVDTLIIIPNQNLFRVANERTTFADAFKMADDVLNAGVRSITDLMIMPGLINLDFADVRTVMSDMGRAMMGTGEASGERRALDAAEAAISNPLLEDTCMKGARGVLINITGGPDITLFEVDEAANRIRDEVESEAHIIFGSCFNPDMEGRMRVSVVATGISGVASQTMPRPQHNHTNARSTTQVPQSPAGGQPTQAQTPAHTAPAHTAPARPPVAGPESVVRPSTPAAAPASTPTAAAARPTAPQGAAVPAAGFRRPPLQAQAPAAAPHPVHAPIQTPAARMPAPPRPAPAAFAPQVPPSYMPAEPETAEPPYPLESADQFEPAGRFEPADRFENEAYAPAPLSTTRPQDLPRQDAQRQDTYALDLPQPPAPPRRPAADAFAPQAPAAGRPAFQAPPQRPAFAAEGSAERPPLAAPAQRPAAAKPEAKPGFFNRLTARLTARDDDHQDPHADHRPEPETPRRGELLAAPEPTTRLSVSAEDRPAPVRPTEEENQLEIPAFLRRQAN